MNSLPDLAVEIKQQMTKIKAFAMLLQKCPNKQIRLSTVFYETYNSKKISDIFPFSSTFSATKSLSDLSNEIVKLFESKHTFLVNMLSSVNAIKAKKSQQNEIQANKIVQSFSEYVKSKFNVFKQMIYLELNYRLDVHCKKVQMHMEVLRKKGIQLKDKDKAVIDIFES